MKGSIAIFLCIIVSTNSRCQSNSLDYFIRQAITNSPLLKDFEGQIRSLSIDSAILRAARKVQVNGISNDLYAPVIHGYGYDEAITNGAQLSALIQVSKSFPGNKDIVARMQSLQVQRNSIGNDRSISEQDIRKTITDQYIVTYGEQLQLDLNHIIVQLLATEDTLLKKLTRDNVYKQTDYLAFVVLEQQQLLTSSQLHIQYETDYLTLNYLAGNVDTTTNLLEEPSIASVVPGDWSSSVFYRQFVLDSLKLLNDRALIGLTYRPKLSFFADGGYNSSLNYLFYKNFGTSIGANLSIPIYDGKQRRLQYSKIDIQEQTRQDKKDFFTRQREQQLLQLMKQLRSIEKLIDQVNKQILYTETLIHASEKLLASGDIRLTDFVLTLSNYINARNLVVENSISRLKIMNQINYWNK